MLHIKSPPGSKIPGLDPHYDNPMNAGLQFGGSDQRE
jgi:hypothetical protein